jgi:molecular chaperone GrpE (heat shock protein)
MSQGNSIYHDRLMTLIKALGYQSIAQFCKSTNVSEKSLRKIRRGQVQQMQLGTLQEISQGLNVSLNDLLKNFSAGANESASSSPDATEGGGLQQEYSRLQKQLSEQRDLLLQEFQQSSLQTIEPWLLQWSAAAYAAEQDPQFPAAKLLPLVRSMESLLQNWGVTAIGSVGETMTYDPQQHQLIEGQANPGESVQVRYAGYRQGDKLLHRAKVSV